MAVNITSCFVTYFWARRNGKSMFERYTWVHNTWAWNSPKWKEEWCSYKPGDLQRFLKKQFGKDAVEVRHLFVTDVHFSRGEWRVMDRRVRLLATESQGQLRL